MWTPVEQGWGPEGPSRLPRGGGSSEPFAVEFSIQGSGLRF